MLYDQVSVLDDDEEKSDLHKIDDLEDSQFSKHSTIDASNSITMKTTAIRNKNLVPITRLPSQPRDVLFGLLFVFHFILVILVSTFSLHLSSTDTILKTGEKGTWSSILMIVTTLGSIFGAIISFLIVRIETREMLFNIGLLFSILFQLCFGNVLLLEHYPFSIFGIFLLLSALFDYLQSSSSKHNMNFTCTLLDFCIFVCRQYGLPLTLACIGLVVIQTCLLLWWGVYLISLFSSLSASSPSTLLLLIVHAASFIWTRQLFHAAVSYLIGGCVLSYFICDDQQEEMEREARKQREKLSIHSSHHPFSSSSPLHDPSLSSSTHTSISFDLSSHHHHLSSSSSPSLSSSVPSSLPPKTRRVLLYLQSALSSSFGSLCRASLLTPLAHLLLTLDSWAKNKGNRLGGEGGGMGGGGGRTGGGGGGGGVRSGGTCGCCLDCFRSFLPYITTPLLSFSVSHSRLSLPLCAVFGKTLASGGEEQGRNHPHSLLLLSEDCASFSLASVSKASSGLLALLVALAVDRHEGKAWALLFFVLFLFVHAGISLSLQAYRSAVDALLVAFSLAPERFAAENQIVYLRFLRNSETALR